MPVIPPRPDQCTLNAAADDVRVAEREFDDARTWLRAKWNEGMPPIAAEVWAFDEDLRQVLLVRHRWRGWVCPGGRVHSGEKPRAAAARELSEETGIIVDAVTAPCAAVFVRSYHSDWLRKLGMAYAVIVDKSLPLTAEPHQPAAWVPLEHEPPGAFPEDSARLREFADRLSRAGMPR